MLPDAPTTFSIVIGWPQISDSFGAKALNNPSGALPGGAGTTTLMDLSGHGFICACATAGIAKAIANQHHSKNRQHRKPLS
jgi:hypothetical protein